MKLDGKIAVVIGSGRGTGRGIALALAQEGADVVTNALTPGNAEKVSEEIKALGRKSIAVTADISVPDQARGVIDKAVETFGRIDILVQNAALEGASPLFHLTDEQIDKYLDTNLKSYIVCAKRAAEIMVEKKMKGNIVAISSIGGLIGFPMTGPYCASKGGMIGLTKQLALDLAPYGIRVNTVAPGVIESKEHPLPEKLRDLWIKGIPLSRFAGPEDIGKAVVFLASDDADYITGCVLPVEGGVMLWPLPFSV